MSIQKLVSEISRKAGSLEIIQHGRDVELKSTIQSRDLLCNAYMLDDSVEFRGITGSMVSLGLEDLDHEKTDENCYRFYNRTINILIRPLPY